MHIISKKRLGFRVKALHKRKEASALHFLSEKMSFWVAVFSLFAFVTGNMVGQHGWHVFWKSVMGEFDDSLIVYEGTVTPIAFVPDYARWAAVGGNPQDHTFRQVPKDILIPLPSYVHKNLGASFSADYMGGYDAAHDGNGSHVGVDIRAPEGTPVRSIANGIITRIGNDPSGFGKFIVIRHPNMPDPANPNKTTTLHSVYAHLSEILVSEGLTIRKGEDIGASGSTGFASGPHLHFQLDRDVAPWHPYWPFTTSEMREANVNFTEAINSGLHHERGELYTVNPMLFVQANYSPVMVAAESNEGTVVKPSQKVKLSLKERRDLRLKQREERRAIAMKNAPVVAVAPSPASSEISPVAAEQPLIVQKETVVSTEQLISGPQLVVAIEFTHDGTFNRGWEKVRIRLLDIDGRAIRSPLLRSDIYLRTAYGKAEFRPEILSVLDFEDGEIVVDVLPRNRGTVVLQAQPTGEMSAPMKYVEE